MALLPYILNELMGDRYDPVERLYDQHFGLGLRNEDVHRRPAMYLRPYRHHLPVESGSYTVHDDKDQFKINLDVQQFKPEEIKVKVDKECVVVEGQHEERQDKHGFISRQFTRRYKLPPNTNVEAIKSNLSSDGVLSITAPKKAIEGAQNREIPITFTNEPAIQQTAKTDDESKKTES